MLQLTYQCNRAVDAAGQSILILNTTDAMAVRTVVIVYVGAVAVEVQAATVAAVNRTGPVDAVAACEVDRGIVVTAVPRHNRL
jgi:hypothetical protein